MNDDQTITVDCLEAYIIQQLNMNWHGQDCTRAHELGLDVSLSNYCCFWIRPSTMSIYLEGDFYLLFG